MPMPPATAETYSRMQTALRSALQQDVQHAAQGFGRAPQQLVADRERSQIFRAHRQLAQATDGHAASDKLSKLSGVEFDRAYAKDQLKAYQRMVSYYQSEADNSTESVATKMAANMLPAVQKHLNDTKDLNKTLTVVASAR